MMVIDKVVQQIILQRDGQDPDPSAALAALDLRSLLTDSNSADRRDDLDEKYRRQYEKTKRLEKELASLSKTISSSEIRSKFGIGLRLANQLELLIKDRAGAIEGSGSLFERLKTLLDPVNLGDVSADVLGEGKPWSHCC